MSSDEAPKSNKIPLQLTEAARESGIVEMYREDETVAVVIKIDQFEPFMERVRIDPKRWSTSVASLMKNIKHALTVKGIDKSRTSELIVEIAEIVNRNYSIFRDLIRENAIRKGEAKNDEKGENGKESSRGLRLAEALVNLACSPENTELFFQNQYGEPFVSVRVGNDKHLEVIPVKSSKYKYYLARLYREKKNGQILGTNTINNALNVLAANAMFDCETIPLHLRVAWGTPINRSKPGSIYYDMTDDGWRSVEISDTNWRIIRGNDKDSPILFRRYKQVPQVEPVRTQFLNLTNVKDKKHRQLVKVYIATLVIPEIAHVILSTHGSKGSAKSFLLRLIKMLIDPSKPVLLTLHKDIAQFTQQVSHNYLPFYDNIKYISQALSDEICKAVTGIGSTKRELYTDDEDIVYEYKHCPSLNGINVALTESDVLDRGLMIELEEIKDEDRRKEEDLLAEFERIRAKVFGYVLDTVVKAMRIKSTLHLPVLTRMADFTEWGEAISRAMGYEKMSFIHAFNENRNEQNIIAIEENVVGSILVRLCEFWKDEGKENSFFKGSPAQLYTTIVDFAADNEINISHRQFPKTPPILVKKLNTIKPNLKQAYGITVKIERDSNNNSVISIHSDDSRGTNSTHILNQTYAVQVLHNQILR